MLFVLPRIFICYTCISLCCRPPCWRLIHTRARDSEKITSVTGELVSKCQGQFLSRSMLRGGGVIMVLPWLSVHLSFPYIFVHLSYKSCDNGVIGVVVQTLVALLASILLWTIFLLSVLIAWFTCTDLQDFRFARDPFLCPRIRGHLVFVSFVRLSVCGKITLTLAITF